MLPNYRSETFKLFYRDQLIGVITNPSTDQPWFMGDIEVTEAFEPFRAGFAWLQDEENNNSGEEPPIDLDNWFIEDDKGVRDDALVTIVDGKEIYWRW